MGFIEILDIEGNRHSVRPDAIAGISDIREYRIIFTTNKDLTIITNITYDVLKRRIKYIERYSQKVNLLGGLISE
ncbi:hypothetical protein AWE51_00140 [Aquimarina aggregata]|uniref:Uncharacterized protein n=1 Tax=Aquimarina aggregata TaxID=1642818 RepID=A0A163BY30_9FLAO|nr:hypothetical protein [Aquimarina aggregata]KZS41890.1 hypothetical protein AWE51_00140 [Aquimarina aggregata]